MSSAQSSPARTLSGAARAGRIAVLLAWMLGIFLLSHESDDASTARSGFFVSLLHDTGLGADADTASFLVRKAAHAFAYFVLGALAFLAAEITRLPRRHQVLASALFVLAYATSDEIHQAFIPGRSGEVRDVILDTVAGAVGIGVILFARHYPERLRGHPKR